eukprot:672459-Ditylum_brightwellii.AAC.2
MLVIMVASYVILNEAEDKMESLIILFEMMKHGIHVGLVLQSLGDNGAMFFNDKCFPFELDKEKLFWKISKPSEEEFDKSEIIEINSLVHELALKKGACRGKKKVRGTSDVPLQEW